jgi:hypothetical protein
VSSAELSLDISELVSRALGGELIDVVVQSEALASRHANLGMSAELIAKAIARAAGMVGVTLPGADEDIIVQAAGAAEAAGPQSTNGFHGELTRDYVADQAVELRRVFLGGPVAASEPPAQSAKKTA